MKKLQLHSKDPSIYLSNKVYSMSIINKQRFLYSAYGSMVHK